MNILILGDIVGQSGRKALIKKLPDLIKKRKLDFVIVNGENAADPGVGITKNNTKEFFEAGADVIFPEAITSIEDMKIFNKSVKAPTLVNMTEFGKTPYLTHIEFYLILLYYFNLFK